MLPPRAEPPGDGSRWDRIYLGSEFCERLIPEEGQVRAVLEALPAPLPMTLVTPYVTDAGLQRIERLAAAFLGADGVFDEVLFNDWGVLRMLRDRPGERVLGRLFARQLRDPRVIDGAHGGGCPEDEFSFSDDFVSFLREQGVRRIELDRVPRGAGPAGGAMRYSLHRPYTYVTTTRTCPVAHLEGPGDEVVRIPRTCSYGCLKTGYVLSNEHMSRDLFLFGNTLYFEHRTDDATEMAGLDRIVQHRLPWPAPGDATGGGE